MTTRHWLAPILLHQASGDRGLEAAITLLAETGCWLDRDDFTSQYAIHALDDDGSGTTVLDIDWDAAITALGHGDLPCSAGESAILELAASLATGEQVSLRDVLPRIDQRSASLAVTAIAHAAGKTACQGACPIEDHAAGSPAELARLLTIIDEFLRSPHMPARLAAFLTATGHQHPGYDACLLIDDVSFTALRLRQLTSRGCDILMERLGVKFP
jgi:hypothetical protein